MELILWRHAEAEDGEPDLARKLTPRGKKQARRAAEWLDRHLPDRTRILVSPAIRAQQTAAALAEISHRKLRTVDAIAPDAGARAVLEAAGWPDAKFPVLVVGHQPTLGQVASLLLSGEIQEWSIRKGGLWWLTTRERDGNGQVLVRAVVSPETT